MDHCAVQVPFTCQPAETLALLLTFMDVFFAPAKPGLNARARFTVRLFPDPDADDEPTLSVHWLLVSVPAPPSIPPEPTYPVPASLRSCAVLVARVYWI